MTRGAANGNSSVGDIAGLVTTEPPPTVAICSLPTQSTTASRSW